MAATGAPASQRETDIYEVAGLPSWTPQTSSAFPPAWSAPPRSRGQRTTFAALGGGAIAAIALCVALVTWSRMPARTLLAATPPVALAAEVAPVPAEVEVAPIVEVVPVAAEVAPVPAELAPIAEVVPVAVEVAPVAVQAASMAEDEAVQVAAPVAAAEPVTLVEEPLRTTELEPPAIAAAADAPTLDADSALHALAALVAEPAEVASVQGAEQATTEPEMSAVPTRETVVAAIDGVRPAVQACAGQRHGRVLVLLTVASDGRVRSAMVSGAFAGTPEGSCIARAVRGARFPAFAQERFEITYPFAL